MYFTCAPRKSCNEAMFSLTPAKLAFIDGYSSSEYRSTLLDNFMPFSCRDTSPVLKAAKSFNNVLKCLSARLILSVMTFSSWSLQKKVHAKKVIQLMTWGPHYNVAEKINSKNCTLFSCKFCENNLSCFVKQHGSLVVWLQTKN